MTKIHLIPCGLAALLFLGCLPEASETGETVATSEAQLVTSVPSPLYTYFRCNATGWIPNSATRLEATSSPGILTLHYDVTQDWMIATGDSCLITQTNEVDAWGTWSREYSTLADIQAGRTAAMTISGQQFRVKYPAKGHYVVHFDQGNGILRIDRETAWHNWGAEHVYPIVQVEPVYIGNWTWSGEIQAGYANNSFGRTLDARVAVPSWGISYLTPRAPIAMSNMPWGMPEMFIALQSDGTSTRNLWNHNRFNTYPLPLDLKELWGVSTIAKPNYSSQSWDCCESRVVALGRNPTSGQPVVAVSNDRGQTWSFEDTQFFLSPVVADGSRITSLHYAASDPHFVWAGTTTGKVIASFDSGATWQDRTDPRMPRSAVVGIRSTAGQTPPRLYVTFAAMKNNNLWETLDATRPSTWVSLHGQGLPTHAVAVDTEVPYTLTPNPVYPDVLYLNGNFGSYVSANHGQSWTEQ